jgi:hypothetical protein
LLARPAGFRIFSAASGGATILQSDCFLRWQASQHILNVGKRIMAVKLGALNQTHHHSGTLPSVQRARKHPVVSLMRSFALEK